MIRHSPPMIRHSRLAYRFDERIHPRSGLRAARRGVDGSPALGESAPEFLTALAYWAEELGILTFIHPRGTPELSRRLRGNGWLSSTIGNPRHHDRIVAPGR